MAAIEELLNAMLCEEYGSIAEFSRLHSLRPTTVRSALKPGKLEGTSSKVFLTLTKSLGIDPYALCEGYIRPTSDNTDYVDVPLYISLSADGHIESRPSDAHFPVPRYIAEAHPRAFLLRVADNSMDRRLPDGCFVLVDPDDQDVQGGGVFALTINGYEATVKQVERLANGIRLIPNSSDPTIQPMVFDFGDDESESITIIGKVVWATFPFDYVV